MKIAITGGTGFIGSYVAEKLISENNEVMCLDRQVGSNLQRNKKISFVQCDISDSKRLIEATKGVDCIIHLGALRSVKESVAKPLEYNKVNIDGTVNVLEAAKTNSIPKVIFASSSAVYGNSFNLPMRESDLALPSSPYGLSKLAGENYCHIYSETFGVDTISFRMFNVYGPRQTAQAGVIAAFTDAVVKNQSVALYGDGSQSRDFVFIEDVAQGFFLAANSKKKFAGKVINIANGKKFSVLEVRDMIEEFSGKKIKLVPEKWLLGDVKDTLADISLAKQTLGWSPKVSVPEGIKKTLDYYLAKER